MIRKHVQFRGRVQGVGFRATTRHVATRHKLVGWVRNEPDGSVTLEVQGDQGAVGAFLDELRAHFVRHIAGESHDSVPVSDTDRAFEVLR